MAVNMWKKSLKNVESDNSKLLYETILDFIQLNGTYFLNKPHTMATSEPFLALVHEKNLFNTSLN